MKFQHARKSLWLMVVVVAAAAAAVAYVSLNHQRGLDAFLSAADIGDCAAIDRMLASDAKIIEARDRFGRSALHLAARHGNLDVVKSLINRGADVGAQDESGQTPLHLALREDYVDVALALISAGACIYTENKQGMSCVDCCCSEETRKKITAAYQPSAIGEAADQVVRESKQIMNTPRSHLGLAGQAMKDAKEAINEAYRK